MVIHNFLLHTTFIGCLKELYPHHSYIVELFMQWDSSKPYLLFFLQHKHTHNLEELYVENIF